MRALVLVLFALFLLSVADARAEGAVAPGSRAPANRGVSPEARAVLERMTAYLQSLQRFSVVAEETRDEVLPYGYKLQDQQHATMLVQRPDRMRVEVDGDIKVRSYVYDGKTLVIHAPESQVYTQVDAPPTIAETVDVLMARGVEMPLIDVLVQAFRGTLASHARAGSLVGESKIDGIAVDHLAFRQADIDWQLWVEKGDRPLPRKLVITTRFEVGDPQYQAVLERNIAPTIAANAFEFAPPAGTRRVRLADGASP
ncbi:MAG TPA: DUF2092 domain-containing protein [Xanthomonadales bacterium]|nr:DUF2092 domain-containing protein [Xanthomonadales bacterium]